MDGGQSDDTLMERASGEDASAFDLIVRRHQDRLQRFASRMLGGDSARAADIAVGAFLRLWEARSTFHSCGKLESWLLTTTYRLCLDSLERERQTESIERLEQESNDRPLQSVVASIEQDAIREAVMALPETHRAVMILSAYEEMSYEAIASALQIPIGTVASRRNHALGMLRKRLAAWEEPK